MCEIGTFALKMGRQDVLDEYRASVAGIMQGAMDRERISAFVVRINFSLTICLPNFFRKSSAGFSGKGKEKSAACTASEKRDGTESRFSCTPSISESVSSWEEKGALGDSVFLYLSNSGLPEPFSRFKLYEATYIGGYRQKDAQGSKELRDL